MNSPRPIRLAHLTDLHLWPDGGYAAQRAGLALEHAQASGAELLLLGGDLVMDALARTPEEVEAQWAVVRAVFADHLRVPVYHALGNHDHFGHPEARHDPRWGKAWAMQVLGLEAPYYAAELGGWRLIVLDSTEQRGADYTARLDEAQLLWLEAQLTATPPGQPVLLLSHIPILSAAAFLDGPNEVSGDWRVPGAWMHLDARRLKDLFGRFPQVRLALSGHLHLADQVLYNGVTYACNGAVCGNWWNRAHPDCQETPPGYATVDLWPDGAFRVEYVRYEP